MIAALNATGSRTRGIIAAALGLFGAALAPGAETSPSTPEPPAEAAAAPYRPPEDPQELLRVDDAMREHFARRVNGAPTEFERLRRLVDAILEPEGLRFLYAPGHTADARETFRRRRGNCASYAFLIVAVAREFGLDARFQSVESDTRWERLGDVVIAARHLDVLVTINDGAFVIDPEPNAANGNKYAMRVITDETAFSLFYCNTGVEHLVRGKPAEARRYLTLATRMDPRYAPAWSNLGTLSARHGDLQAAKAEFKRSLDLDLRGEVALDGYVTVLRRLGTPDDLRQADKLERRAQAVRARNPYRQQVDALRAVERGDLATAEKLLRRAIKLKGDEPEFYLQWSAVLQRLGRTDESRRALAKLEKLQTRLRAGPRPLQQ